MEKNSLIKIKEMVYRKKKRTLSYSFKISDGSRYIETISDISEKVIEIFEQYDC